jgi:hypothetical protein
MRWERGGKTPCRQHDTGLQRLWLASRRGRAESPYLFAALPRMRRARVRSLAVFAAANPRPMTIFVHSYVQCER